MIKIVCLDSKNIQSFEQFVLTMLLRDLDKLDNHLEQIALGAEDDGQPVGLLLAGAVPSIVNPGTFETDHWEIKQIYVPPAHRKAGIGRELLKALEVLLRARGVKQLSLTYALEEDRRNGVDAFVVKCGWPAPVTETYQYRISRSRVNSRWIGSDGREVRKYQLPEGVIIADFTTLTEREKSEVTAERDTWYPAYLAPFTNFDLLYLENSLLLRVNGAIAGWIYAIKYGLGTVFYRGIFVKAEYRSSVYGLYLLAAAINRQFDKGDENAMFVVNVKNHSMQGWIDWMLGGDYEYIWETRTAKQQLE
jgi:GNAT superfamily N-acetyltransferase